MNLIKYEPFRNDPWSDLDRLFESSFPELLGWRPARAGFGRSIPMDFYEEDDKRVARFELPGFRNKDIELELENAVLSVKAKRDKDARSGREAEELQRTVTVGDDVDPENVRAKFENGLLTVELPKREQAKPRQITIS